MFRRQSLTFRPKERESGAVFIEVAAALPVFVLLIAGALQIGCWYTARAALTRAVGDTLQAAATLPDSPDPAWQDDAAALASVFDQALGPSLPDRRVRVVVWTVEAGAFDEANARVLVEAGSGSCGLPAPDPGGTAPRDGARVVTVQACGSLSGPLTTGIVTAAELTASAAMPARFPLPLSCRELYNAGITTNGVYRIDPDADDVDADGTDHPPFNVRCDMTGGGWTLVAAQFESNPAPWTEGIAADYDPSLGSGVSFALGDDEIPPHLDMGFGANEDAGSAAVLTNRRYTTGDINLHPTSNSSYEIYRNGETFYKATAPDGSLSLDPGSGVLASAPADWLDCLVVDQTNAIGRNWWFCPNATDPKKRGFAINGAPHEDLDDAGAWTIWVR
jgi:hypothetical protein